MEFRVDYLTSYIVSESERQGIDPDFVLSIAYTESRFNPYVTRFEAKWSYFFNVGFYSKALGVTETTEKVLQSISWGPLQVMGTVCRELGYADHLAKLGGEWSESTLYGIKKLKAISRKYSDIHDIASSYNQGSPVKNLKTGLYNNQEYVDNVIRYYLSLKK